ncbi:MAG: glycogen debranching N-terminal domain-containing protein [Acidimicrobiia bacterium]
MPEPWTSSASSSLGGRGGTVTLVEGSAFCISVASGDMHAPAPEGLFFRDTRFVSDMTVRINGQLPELLSSNTTDPFSGAFVLRDRPAPGLADSNVLLFRNRYVGRGMREDFRLENFGDTTYKAELEVSLYCDFADLFEVKEGRIEERTGITATVEDATLTFAYAHRGFSRATRISFSQPGELSEYSARFRVAIPARDSWEMCMQVTPVIGDTAIEPRYQCGQPVAASMPVERLQEWRRQLPVTSTDNPAFQALLSQSAEDLAGLRIFDPEHPDRVVVAAGAPWYMTLFGRDSLLTSWMAMLVDSDLALGTLQTLERYQGKDVDPITEEQPGRILHEMRFGETTALSLGGGRVYYGTVDATPLFVMLLGELQRWGNRREEVDALLPAADRALEWMEKFGDIDGDGYLEYERTSDRGLSNQGWKDSWDSIRFADGELAHAPIALCEVQGYAYAAYIARAYFAIETGDNELAARYREKAYALKRKFNEDFWLDDVGAFAIALNRDKRPVNAISSNMGHCLWTGIVDAEKAPLIAQHMMSEAMFSGWGVRTLSANMTAYNPTSYHNGSVWPHDNAIIAAGLMRYGFTEEAHRIMGAMTEASAHFGARLPELFAGLDRTQAPFPVTYPASCSPQAWAAASPLLHLRTMLRFEPDIRNAELHLAPILPEWIGSFSLQRIPLMGGYLSVEAEGEHLHVSEIPDGLTVVRAPRVPSM